MTHRVVIQELDLSYSPHSITPGPDNGRSAIILLPNLKSLNLTCSLVLNHTMCDEGLYQYESPLDPELLKVLLMLMFDMCMYEKGVSFRPSSSLKTSI